MLPSWCRDAVTVTRPAWVESRGTLVPNWSKATSHPLTGCSVQVPLTSMDLDGRQQAELSGTLYAPNGADVARGDRITWTDPMGVEHDFAVDGMPMPWSSPSGRVSHVQARLVEWRG